MKNWLRKANGWKRIWFILTCLLLIISCFFIIRFINSAQNEIDSDQKTSLGAIQMMANPECMEFLIIPHEKLPKWKYREKKGDCDDLLSYRRYLYPKDNALPLTQQRIEDNTFWRAFWNRFAAVTIPLGIAIIISGLIYLCGLSVAWIISGFRSKDQ